MSKAVRWQVPFAAQNGTKYRVDIYDEGYTGSPVELTAGETPFTTDEDDSDDFFAPVRTQSGTLQICTETPSGSTIKLEDIIPANNIARPIRLVNLSNSNAVEWQGFLSCEAYSQDYIGIPQNLDLPLIGVLEAMASVEADPAKLSGLNMVGTTIEKLLDIFIDKAGVSYFSEYYLPNIARGSNIVSKYIDASVLFEQKEYNNENSTTYIVSGLSLQDCLARIATYMGWCLREKSGTLYFMAANETVGYNRVYRTGVVNSQGNIIIKWQGDLSVKSVSTQNIDDLDWMGNGHQRSVAQGAKSVEVVAKLKKYEFGMSLPECPVGDLVINPTERQSKWGEIHANTKDDFNSAIEFGMIQATGSFGANMGSNSLTLKVYSNYADYENSIFWKNNGLQTNYEYYVNDSRNLSVTSLCKATSYMAYWRDANNELQSGLLVCGIPKRLYRSYGGVLSVHEWNRFALTADNFLYKQSSVSYFSQRLSGYINLYMEALAFADANKMDCTVQTDSHNHVKLAIALSIGNMWLRKTGSTYSWSSSFATIEIEFVKDNEIYKTVGNWSSSLNVEERDGIFIPIQSNLQGEVCLRIYHEIDGVGIGDIVCSVFDVLLSKIDVSYVNTNEELTSDRSENKYFRLLGTNFRDEISIDTEFASSMNNQPSPSLIMNSTTEAMTKLNYGSTQSPDMRRPEVDLLNRLAAYYGAARQRLELEVAHITTPLPQLRLNGINDGKVYLPMAESRDWRTGVCKLTCIECPQ